MNRLQRLFDGQLPRLAMFDLDGTLVDNFEAIHRCYDDVMSMMGLPGVTLEQIEKAVDQVLQVGTLALPRDNDVARAKTQLIASVTYRRDSQYALASAYGIAVTGVMVIDTFNAGIVARKQWVWPSILAIGLFGAMGVSDIIFFISNSLKIPEGGWLPLFIATAIFLGMDQKRDELLYSNIKGKNPFADKRVRQALAMAVDRSAITDLVLKTGEIPGYSFVPPGVDNYGEPAPFAGVPREWNAVVQKYGADLANKNGRVPWRAEEIFDKLVTTFVDAGKNPGGYSLDNARYLSAVLAHYVEDAHQPFHGVANYDGQLTNQRGIHSRFETELVLREPGVAGGEECCEAHAASTSSATSVRNVSSRLVSPLPAFSRSSSSVPCAIRRPPAITPMRSAMRSATSRMCVVMMTVPPFATRSRSTFLTCRAEPASSPVSGSSRMMRRGSWTSAPASATFCRMPLEKPSQRSRRCFHRSSVSHSSRARSSVATNCAPWLAASALRRVMAASSSVEADVSCSEAACSVAPCESVCEEPESGLAAERICSAPLMIA